MSVRGSEKAEITRTVDLYVQGVRNGDGAKLREAFHPQAWMFGSVAGTRYDEPIGELIALVEEHPADVDGSFQARVVSVEQVGDAAFAVLEEQGFWGTVSTRRSPTPEGSRRRCNEREAQLARTLYVQLTVTTRPSWEPVSPVRPVWLDIDQCGDSEHSIAAGFSDTHGDWTVNVPGKAVAALGDLHGHRVAVEAANESEGGRSICRSIATLDPADVRSVLAMSTCTGDPLATVKSAKTVRLHSEYQSSHPADNVMGIMLAYIRPA